MSEHSSEHATFTIERTYGAAPERVFAAWADPQIKYRWFGPPDGPNNRIDMDFRVGGHERFEAGVGDATYIYDALYQDIVENRRIVYTYEMYRDEDRMSVCVSTVELEPSEDGTKLTYTEQGVFLDGHDTAAMREHGTREILGKLEAALEGS